MALLLVIFILGGVAWWDRRRRVAEPELNAAHAQALPAVASAYHTVGLLVAVVAVSVLAAISGGMSDWMTTLARPRARLLLYMQMVFVQWVYVGYVWIGTRRSSISLRSLIDSSKLDVSRWLRYLGVAIGGFVLWLAIGAGLSSFLRPSADDLRNLSQMFPRGPMESALWVIFSLSAGFSEELVYRGYLLRQFRALSGSALGALLLQAVVFGVAHLVLPMALVVSVVILALLLGGLAIWQKSLVPGIILHSAIGLLGAFTSGR